MYRSNYRKYKKEKKYVALIKYGKNKLKDAKIKLIIKKKLC